MDIATQVQNLDKTVCILYSTNNLEKEWIWLFSVQL